MTFTRSREVNGWCMDMETQDSPKDEFISLEGYLEPAAYQSIFESQKDGYSDYLPSYGSEDETMKHVLFHSPKAIRVWQLSVEPFANDLEMQSTQIFLEALQQSLKSETMGMAGIKAAYIAYRIWLAQNAGLFEARWWPARLVERAMNLAIEIAEASLFDTTLKTQEPGTPFLTIRRRIFITQEPRSPTFLKINFDGSGANGSGGARFIIRDPDSQLIATGGVWLVETSMPGAKLKVAQKEIYYARLTLRVDRLIVEDSFVVVAWLQGCPNRGTATHPLVCDIRRLLLGCAQSDIRHIYCEANNAVDWIASFVVQHSDGSY